MRYLKFVALSALLACLTVAPASALTSVFNLSEFTGTSADVRVEIDDSIFLDMIQVTVEVVANPNIGDIRGVFFNIDGAIPALVSADITGADVTGLGFDTNNLGNGANLNPHAPFDLGVEIGTQGIGFDDIQTTTFTIADKGVLTAGSFTEIGARLTSVGLDGSSREGSSKLSGTSETPIPEPATMTLLVGGLLAGGAMRRRRS
ncbi:MAG: PEP-CTERM sorting domain-containing protein [Candidatus Eisenbacteria bacterium]|uniref:PEP-CTERM sorting domain-containing protein n=1 Tax=Eiseniibacteriota bacterium TaxID=2212470 RepID=A0A7Y2EE56_UNCEI|nr:PEP-CTERM sorting domain-containing protein [Candidatus Eisenbacteria bacterium]